MSTVKTGQEGLFGPSSGFTTFCTYKATIKALGGQLSCFPLSVR